ncbi:MAG: glycosyltransferase [Acidobacteriota bacterium]|nr:glycosyltransferase [Acidobacteriota bacterium]
MSVQQSEAFAASVIIPVHNRKSELQACLTALVAQDFPLNQFEVIVCDDGSTEDFSQIIAAARQRQLQITHVKQPNKGPAAARNLGIRHANAEIVAMTDSDTLPDTAWLRNLIEALAADPSAVGVEGKVFANNESEFAPLGEGPENQSGGVYLTCNMAYRRRVLIEVGGFDETFPFPAYEDVELAARAIQRGKILWQPAAVITHPQRPLTLKTVWKKLKHWEFVLRMGYRYGYFGWPRYPTKWPKLYLIGLAVIALPLSKWKQAAACVTTHPAAAAKLFLFGLVESLGAMAFVAPKVIFLSRQKLIERHHYLGSLG